MKELIMSLSLVLICALPSHATDGDPVALGDSCLEMHDTFGALEYYGAALALDSSAAVVRKVARCHYMRGDYGRCVSTMLPVAGPGGDSLSLEQLRYVFDSYRQMGETAQVVTWGQAILRRCPMDGEVTAAVAQVYISDNAYSPNIGRNLAWSYLKRDSTCIPVLRQYADANFLLKDFDAAERAYLSLMELGDSTYNTIYSLGMTYMQTERDSLARLWLKRAAEKSGMKNAGCLYRLGIVCVDMNLADEGIMYLNLAFSLMQPDQRVAFVVKRALGEGYYKKGHYWSAIYAWEEALRYNRNSMATIFNTAQAYGLVGNDEKEKAFYRAFLSMAALAEPNEALDGMVRQAEAVVGGHEDFKGAIVGPPI